VTNPTAPRPLVEVLTFQGCPHIAPALALAQEVTAALAPGATVRHVDVTAPEQAAALRFPGSPTLRVEGRDVTGEAPPAAFSCRVYENGAGVPPRWMVEAALLRALAPRRWLFLCVANSARSQMAEGIARALAPAGVTVASAGSQPTAVRPEAVAALAEIGIDIAHQAATSVADVPPDSVDVAVTLCAEEVCPAFLGDALRVHWGLPDPAAVTDPDARRAAFRRTRDELRRRLGLIWG